jgi:hypothetical protein
MLTALVGKSPSLLRSTEAKPDDYRLHERGKLKSAFVAIPASKGAGRTMSDEKVGLLCDGCGEEFSAFLNEMAEHNAKVTACPKCGKNHEFKPPKAANPVAKRLVKKKQALNTT